MTDNGLDRGSLYRRRLARAAAGSLALHMILFGGLTVSRLEFSAEHQAEAEAKEPEKPKRAADFRLNVSRATSSEKPAHERPLTLSVPMEAARPADARERPTDRSVADRREAAAEAQPTVTPSRTEFERSKTEDVPAPVQPAVAPERMAEVAPTESPSTADMAAAAAATESSTAASTAPASTQARDRGDSGPVAARWRPREVALLEKLTASAPVASALTAREVVDSPASAASSAPARRTTRAAASPSVVRAQTIAPVATQATASSEATASAARVTARRSSPATSAASRSMAPGANTASTSPTAIAATSSPMASVTRSQTPSGVVSGGATGSRSATRAPGMSAGEASTSAAVATASGGTTTAASTSGGSGQLVAPATGASGGSRPGRQTSRGSALGGTSRRAADVGGGTASDGEGTSGTIAGGASAGTGLADLGGGLIQGREGLGGGGTGTMSGSGSPGRDAGGITAGSTGTGSLALVTPTGRGGSGEGGGSGTAPSGIGPGGTGESLMPAAMDRSGRRGGGLSALASRGAGSGAGSGKGGGESEHEGEGLSVTPADIASLMAAGRDRRSDAARSSGPRSLERMAAMALPTDGRVRDVAQAFAGRSGGGSEPAGGITDRETLDRARTMVNRGLDFLVRSQLPDGRWRLTEYAGATPADTPKLESDTAATGLALLCFLGAGHDHFSGPHRDTVRRGLEFLVTIQQDDGDLFLPADDLSNSCSWLYSHGMASIAICEAVGMTGDPRLKPAAEKACRFIAASSHPTLGGWRYIPRTDADLSVSGWMLIALRAGNLAGVKTDPAALNGVRTLLAASISPSDPARYAYNPRKPDQRRTDLSVACMTAVGGLMRLHTGETPETSGVAATAKALAAIRPSYGSPTTKTRDAYLWYYASQVLVHTGGNDWQAWYASLVDTLEKPQHTEGELAGSWDPLGETPDRWGEYGGRLYVTTLHLLALEVPWRHLPTYATARGK